ATQAAGLVAPSLIGEGLRFDGSASATVAPSAALAFAPDRGYTISAWLRVEGGGPGTLVAAQDQGNGFTLAVENDRASASGRDAGTEGRVAQPAGTLAGEWHHVALRAGAGRIALLLDGAEVAAADAPLRALNPTLTIGTGWRGELDELQVAGTARGTAWL